MHNLSDFLVELGLSNPQLDTSVYALITTSKGKFKRYYSALAFVTGDYSDDIIVNVSAYSVQECFEGIYKELGLKA